MHGDQCVLKVYLAEKKIPYRLHFHIIWQGKIKKGLHFSDDYIIFDWRVGIYVGTNMLSLTGR
jgi:hypothetical protein